MEVYWVAFGTVYVLITLIVFRIGLESYRDPREEDVSYDRIMGARAMLLAPLWPLVVIVLICVFLGSGIYNVVKTALGKLD